MRDYFRVACPIAAGHIRLILVKLQDKINNARTTRFMSSNLHLAL